MDFAYPPRLVELQERAAALTAQIMPYEEACEEHNGLGPEAHAAIRRHVLDSGLQAINMPSEWGGAGLSLLEQVVVQEQLGKLTGALWDTVWRPANALRACTPSQRERYLIPDIKGERRDAVAITERESGSDPMGMETTAERVSGGFRLNGEKWFVTVGDAADFLIVLARVQPDNVPSLFLVDKHLTGVRINRVPRYMHTFVYEHPEFVFENVELAADSVLGEAGRGYELTRGWFTEERLMIGARTVGAAERALTLAAEWTQQRSQFGEPLARFQLIQGMLADSAVDIAVNRALVHQVAWEFDQGGEEKTLHAKAAMAKLSASEAAGRVVDRAVQIFGGRGYMREYPVERLYRELRVDRIWEGTSEIQRLVIANEIAKRGLHALLALPRQATTPEAVSR
jgi:butyryl-CoA dehydrogenase